MARVYATCRICIARREDAGVSIFTSTGARWATAATLSREDFKQSAWAFQKLMEAAKAEIDSGERLGAHRKWTVAHPKVRQGLWWQKAVLFAKGKR